MIKLTKENYFSTNNGALSSSKIKDFLRCKNYFYRKHIEGSIEQTKTKAFDIGSAVDDLLTQIGNKSRFAVVEGDGRLKAVKEEREKLENKGLTVLNSSDYQLIIDLASAVEKTSAYQFIMKNNFVLQDILQVPYDFKNGLFTSLAGIPDFYRISGDTATIVDLKTTTDINPRKYHYTCEEYSYYRQIAFYGILLQKLHPEIECISYYHLSVAKQKDIYPVKLFELSQERIEMEKNLILQTILPAISSEEEFAKEDCSFATPELIGAVYSEEF